MYIISIIMLLVLFIKSLFTRCYKIINKNILKIIFISKEISVVFVCLLFSKYAK